jgi:23S rRNA-/tRNA-specific pseudouridylate synthase
LAAWTPQFSRARVQDSIRSGHVAVNGAVQTKTAVGVQPGDTIDLQVFEPAAIAAVPQVRQTFTPPPLRIANFGPCDVCQGTCREPARCDVRPWSW